MELVGSGKVALFIATPGQLNIQPRIDGAMAAIEESGADIQAEAITTGAALEEELSTVEAWYLGNTTPPGCSPSMPGAPRPSARWWHRRAPGTRHSSAPGDTTSSPMTVELVADGTLDFTIDQQPYLQGFLPVLYMYLYKLSGGVATPPETNTGLVFLDSTSAQLFLETAEPVRGRRRGAEDRRAGCLNQPRREDNSSSNLTHRQAGSLRYERRERR